MRSAATTYRAALTLSGVTLLAMLACLAAAVDLAGFHAPAMPRGSFAVVVLALVGAVAVVTGIVRSIRRARIEAGINRRLVGAASRLPTVDGPCGEVVVVPAREAYAFSAGIRRPRAFISRGALDVLSDPEVDAVLLHEGHHVRRRDPLRRLLLRVLSDLLFFVPLLGWLTERFETLAEVDADRAAVRAQPSRQPLASALLVLSDPLAGAGVSDGRVDDLLGLPGTEHVPRRALLGASSVISALALAGLLLAAAAGHVAA